MSNILKGIINEAHYPEDPDEYEAMFGARRKSKRMEPDEPQEPYDPWDDHYRRQDIAQKKYNNEVNVKYLSKEGVAPNGERYNNIFVVHAANPYQGSNEIRKFEDIHWGAKKIVDVVKKEPSSTGEPYLTVVYYVDNHKHGMWRPWKDEPPIQKALTFENPVEHFGQMLEGISQEDLANILCHRIEMRYPDIYKKYDYDKMYAAVDDVASFHEGAEELGSSDINIMIRQVFKRLEESEGLDEGSDQKYSVTIDAIDHGVLGAIIVSANNADEAKQKVISGVKKAWAKRGDELMVRSVSVKPVQGVAEGQNSSKFLYAFGEPGEGEYLVTFAQGKTNSGTYVDDMNKATLLAKKKNQESIQQDSSHNRRHHFAAMDTAKGPIVLQGQISSFPSKRFPSVEAAQKFVDEFNDSLGKDYMLSIHKVQQGMAEGSPVDLRKKISKYEELALAANRVGDDEKCKLYQKKIQALKQKMSQGVTEGLNTTEQKLLDMGRNQKYIYINGKQQHEAAKKLVAKGLAEKYDDVSYYASGGEYYINPFTRKQGLTKGGVRVYGGTLYFKDNGKAEEQLDELKCWDGYKRVPGTKAGTPGSCKEIEEGELNELSTDRLAKYKTASAADARAADKAGDFARGNKRFAGIVKATKKQFDNETKLKKESAIMKGLVDENLGTPYLGTYEQECGPFKRKGQERTMKIAFEGKKNVSRRT